MSISTDETLLNEDEAAELAKELKAQLKAGNAPKGDARHIQLMVAGLGDRRGLLRRTFAESLGIVGKAAVPALREALNQHSSATVRRAAAKTLKLVGDPSTLPDLLAALLNDPDPVVQGSAAGAMAIFGADAVDLLLEVLINPKSTAMQCGFARWGVAFVGAQAPDALRNAAQSEHAEIRAAAIAGLGEQIQALEDEDARRLLLGALDDPASDVRAEATTLLGKLHDPSWAQPMLLARLEDQHPQIRKNAALSLMKLQATEALGELRRRKSMEKDQGVITILQLAIDQLVVDD
ncbi:MAG: HEAT repeat domain-containing protein [Prochlorococcus sp.]|nr:HEAT repeat domain-containing protein [Prochlorococcaceae cyanobacterium Fu_MAG_72]